MLFVLHGILKPTPTAISDTQQGPSI